MRPFDFLRKVYARLIAGGSTEQQVVQSGIWVAGINVGDRVLQLLKVVILARLLSPAAFGLLGIALLTIAALRKFSELGFDQALIQHEDENVDAYLNTAWVIKIVRGAAIAAIAFGAAPYLAAFFGEAEAEPIIRIIGFSPLILGLQNPAVMYFQKNLNFHREFVYQAGGRVVDLMVAVGIAVVFQSAWALAVGIVSMSFTKFVLSYLIHEYRPSVEFNLERGKEMFGFGKWMLASAVLVFLYGQGDDAFVGWYFTATTLGFYQIAYRLSNAPATEVTHVISRVAFPAFSKVQNDTDRLREGYLRSLQLSTLVGFPMAAGIIAVAPQFVNVVLGNQWDPMVPLVQILGLWGALRAVGANFGPVFKSVGRPDYDVKIQSIKVFIIILIIYPAASRFGVLGVAAVIVGNTFISQPIAFYIAIDILDAKVSDIISILAYPLGGSILMGISVISIGDLLPEQNIISLSIMIVFGVLVYTAIIVVFDRITSYEVAVFYDTVKKSI